MIKDIQLIQSIDEATESPKKNKKSLFDMVLGEDDGYSNNQRTIDDEVYMYFSERDVPTWMVETKWI